MLDWEKREECISNIEQQIGWIENIEAHQFPGWGHTVSAMRQAIAMLKTQKPRILTLEEIHGGMAVWLEYVDKAEVILAIGGSSAAGAKCFITQKDLSIALLESEYGIRWRAWTAEPTKVQREATPWKRSI